MSRARRLGPDVVVTPFPWAGPDLPVVSSASPVAPPPITLPGVPTSAPADLEQAGFKAGYADGERAGREVGAQEAEARLQRLAEAVAEIDALRRHLTTQAERLLVQLALAIARRVVGHVVDTDPDVPTRLAKAALSRIEAPGPVTLRLHPEDAEAVQATLADGTDAISVVPDPHVPRGGCQLESASGFLDASVETQLEEIAQAVLLDEPAAVREKETTS